MSDFFETYTTGRWTSWLPFSPYCIPPRLLKMGETGSGGPFLTKGLLMLVLSIRILLAKMLFYFPGKAFGGPRLH